MQLGPVRIGLNQLSNATGIGVVIGTSDQVQLDIMPLLPNTGKNFNDFFKFLFWCNTTDANKGILALLPWNLRELAWNRRIKRHAFNPMTLTNFTARPV